MLTIKLLTLNFQFLRELLDKFAEAVRAKLNLYFKLIFGTDYFSHYENLINLIN